MESVKNSKYADLNDQGHGLKPIRTKIEEEEDREGEPLSPVARLFHQPSTNLCIVVIVGFKTRINPDIFKAGIVDNLLQHPRLSRFSRLLQVVDGQPTRWVPTEVDLEKHVIFRDIDPNLEAPDKFIEDYVSNLTKTTMDISKPLWDLHLLNIQTSDAEAVGVFRIHHSLGDGASLMSGLLACTRKASDPEARPTIPVMMMKKPTRSNGFWSACRLVWNTMVDMLMFIATIFFFKDTKTLLILPTNYRSTMPRRLIHRTVSLDDIKLVKNAMNTTINDVVMGVVEAGLSRYLNRRYGEGKKYDGAKEKTSRNNLPKNLKITAPMMINLRSSLRTHDHEVEVKWGNVFGFVLLPFTVALRDDPLDYIRNAKVIINRKKHSGEATCIAYMTKLILNFFNAKLAGFVFLRPMTQTTMSFSNIVGPVEEVALYGHPITYLAPTCYGQPNALMIHFQSYVNKMSFVLSVDEGTIPDPHLLSDDLQESLKLFKDAILKKDR